MCDYAVFIACGECAAGRRFTGVGDGKDEAFAAIRLTAEDAGWECLGGNRWLCPVCAAGGLAGSVGGGIS